MKTRRRGLRLALSAVALLASGAVGILLVLVRPHGPLPGAASTVGTAIDLWDRFVAAHVGADGRVAYAGACADPRLEGALAAFASAADVAAQDAAAVQAFRIDAYNAWTVRAVCRNLPFRSLRDRPWEWRLRRIPVARERTTLHALEARIRHAPPVDPRIHFALNCASESCPVLRPEAYRGEVLEAQLAHQEAVFLADRARNPGPDGEGRVGLSSIFLWYAADFALMSVPGPPFDEHPPGEAVALRLLHRHGDEGLRRALMRPGLMVDYVPYDWSLNEARAR